MAHDDGLLPLLRLPEPVHRSSMLMLVLGDNSCCSSSAGKASASALPADRLLVHEEVRRRRRQEGVHRQPHRRLRLRPRHVPDLRRTFGTLDLPDNASSRRPACARDRRPGTLPRHRACCCSSAPRGKSAQFPLYVWLPDAMEGPTPVSALIHAATMVTAGVYMVARSHALFAPGAGGARRRRVHRRAHRALRGHASALVQNDIKKVLAYSTVSQLGYMFLAVGVGRLRRRRSSTSSRTRSSRRCSSSAPARVIHALRRRAGHAEDGRPASKMPITFWTLLIGARRPSPASRASPASSARTRSWQAALPARVTGCCWVVGADHRGA